MDTLHHVAVHSEHVEEIKLAIQAILGQLVWLVLVAILYGLLHEFAKEWIAGAMWKLGQPFRKMSTVLFLDYNMTGVVEHIGTLSSTFTLYIIGVDKKIVGGWSIVIPNSELRKMNIAEYKPQVDIPEIVREAVGRP